MALDPYAPCPCGSGKKSKFCCLDIAPAMEKVSRLRANGQFEQAMSSLEKIDAKTPDRPWVLTTQAALFNDAYQFDQARDALKRVLKVEPAHPVANALYAMAVFNLDGWPAAKPLIHRAFKACVRDRPDAIAPLAGAVAEELLDGGHLMAARQHLVLALRFAHPDDQRRAFMELMELDGDNNEFYPLRGPHSLESVTVADDLREGYEKALKQAAVGCFEEAADSLEGVTGQSDDVPAAMLAELALLRAWDADPERAAAAFEQAAAATDSDGDAVDWYAIAALLRMTSAADSPPLVARQFSTESVARTLSRFDEHPRMVRTQSEDGMEQAAGLYLVLDRDAPESYADDIDLDGIARILARVSVATGEARYDNDGQPLPQVSVFGVDNDGSESGTDGDGELSRAIAVITDADADLSAADTRPEEERILGRVAAEIEAVRWEPYIPPQTHGAIHRRLTRDHWVNVFDRIWPETPAVVLGGRSPNEVRGTEDREDRRRLAAALQILDAIGDTNRMRCPVGMMAEHYGIPEVDPVPVTDELPINTLTVPQLMRVPRADLSDEQFRLLLQRVLLIGHSRFIDEAVGDAIDRGVSLDGIIERERAFFTLADTAGRAADTGRALEWVTRGLQELGDGPEAFQARVQLKVTELGLRLERPDAPETQSLLRELWENYAAKMPELKDVLDGLCRDFGIDPPWGSIETGGAIGAGEAGGGGIWTPGQPEPAASGGGGIVLP